VDRRRAGRDGGERGGEDSPLTRILGILGLPHPVDRDGPVRDALVIQAHRLSRAGSERERWNAALLELVERKDPARMLPIRAVRLCRALDVPGHREAEERARKAGILTFHAGEILERAGAELLRDVGKLLASPRKVARTAARVQEVCPKPREGFVDAATLRFVRRLATGVRAKKRGAREKR
jgi:hypothetical protein